MKKILPLLLSVLLSLLLAKNVSAMKIDDLGKVMFIGDSYCMGSNALKDGNNSVENGWVELVAKKLEMTNYVRVCAGGTGFYHKNENNQDYLALVQDYVEHNSDLADIRRIIIFAGFNDQWHSYDEVMIRGEETIKYIIQNFPNATISLGMVGWHNSNQEYQLQLANVSSQSYRDLADYMKIKYIEDSELVLIDKGDIFSPDDYHPNLAGQELMADFIANYLQAELVEQYATAITPEPFLQDINKRFPIYLVIITGAVIAIIIVVRLRLNH